jgi:hypothetical protein
MQALRRDALFGSNRAQRRSRDAYRFGALDPPLLRRSISHLVNNILVGAASSTALQALACI